MTESSPDFDNLSEGILGYHFGNPLGTGEEREFAGAPYNDTGMGVDALHDLLGSGQVDPERFFGEKMLTGPDRIRVNRFVKIVGNGDVNCIDIFTT